MTTPGANSDEIASASFYLPPKLYRHRRHSCQLSGPPFADIVPNSGTWIAFVKARHSVEDPGITNAMSALSQKTIASTSDQCPLLPSKADVTLRSYGSRGPEFNDGNEGNQNKDGQHGGLRDREGWLSLSRR